MSEPEVLLVAVHALNAWTLDDIVTRYAISKTECIRLLVAAGPAAHRRSASEQSHPGASLPAISHGCLTGRSSAIFAVSWRRISSPAAFDGKGEQLAFVSGMLSRNSNTVVQHHIGRSSAEFAELHNQDVALPLDRAVRRPAS